MITAIRVENGDIKNPGSYLCDSKCSGIYVGWHANGSKRRLSHVHIVYDEQFAWHPPTLRMNWAVLAAAKHEGIELYISNDGLFSFVNENVVLTRPCQDACQWRGA